MKGLVPATILKPYDNDENKEDVEEEECENPNPKTLTDEDVAKVHDKILSELESKLDAKLRTN